MPLSFVNLAGEEKGAYKQSLRPAGMPSGNTGPKRFKLVVGHTEGIALHFNVHAIEKLLLVSQWHTVHVLPEADRVHTLGQRIAIWRVQFRTTLSEQPRGLRRSAPCVGHYHGLDVLSKSLCHTRWNHELTSWRRWRDSGCRIEERYRLFDGYRAVMLECVIASHAVSREPIEGVVNVGSSSVAVCAVVGGLLCGFGALLLVGIAVAWPVSPRASRARAILPSISSD